MKLPNIHTSHGRYYKIVHTDGKPVWLPLTRVSEGHAALLEALRLLEAAPIASGFQRAIDGYLAQHLPTLTPAVRREHERMFSRIADVFKQFTSVDQVRPRHCLQFLQLYATKPTARQAYKYRMSAFFSWCVVQELCDTNPLREIKVAGPPPHVHKWTDALFLSMREQLSPMLQCYHDLSFLLFQRPHDVRLLERRQIDATHIHFRPTKTARTSNASVAIGITADIRRVLDRAADISRATARQNAILSPYVLHTSTGGSFTKSAIYSAYLRADTKLHGQPIGLNAKDLRPYASTCAEAQGYTRREIQRHMAHRRQGTTDIYLDQHTTPVSGIALRLPEGK